MGGGGKSVSPATDFYWSPTDEPHASRRRAILAKYPQIQDLYGNDPREAVQIAVMILLQLGIAYYAHHLSWFWFVLIAWAVGGTCNHSLQLAGHELCHALVFKKPIHNTWLSIVCNFVTGVPSAITFKRYHLEHHTYQGVDGIDVDIPTELEGRLIYNKLGKLIFVIFQSAFYALRPTIVHPKPFTKWEFINIVAQLSFDFAIFHYWGGAALGYFLLSTFLGLGPHPISGHFIAEHYMFVKGQETYSYYGPLNWVTFNVGYHNEHHDFPRVPGSRLPLVRAMAPEFYDMPQTASWPGVLIDFIMDDSVSCFSRVKRKNRLTKTEENETKSD